MPAETHRAIIHRLVEQVYNQANLAAVDTVYAPIFQLNGLPTRIEDFKQAITLIHATIRGFHVTTGDLVTSGDLVTVTWTIHSTPIEPERGTGPAPGEGVWTSIHLFRIVEGMIVEEWLNWDALSQLQQLDSLHMPELPAGYQYH